MEPRHQRPRRRNENQTRALAPPFPSTVNARGGKKKSAPAPRAPPPLHPVPAFGAGPACGAQAQLRARSRAVRSASPPAAVGAQWACPAPHVRVQSPAATLAPPLTPRARARPPSQRVRRDPLRPAIKGASLSCRLGAVEINEAEAKAGRADSCERASRTRSLGQPA